MGMAQFSALLWLLVLFLSLSRRLRACSFLCKKLSHQSLDILHGRVALPGIQKGLLGQLQGSAPVRQSPQLNIAGLLVLPLEIVLSADQLQHRGMGRMKAETDLR